MPKYKANSSPSFLFPQIWRKRPEAKNSTVLLEGFPVKDDRNDSSIQLENKKPSPIVFSFYLNNETVSVPNASKLDPNASSDELNRPLGIWSDDRLDTDSYRRFIQLLKQDVFEPDYYCESENYFMDLYVRDRIISFHYLSRAIADYKDDDHIQEGVLHILSSLSYDEVYPDGQMLLSAISSTKDVVLQEMIVRCYEHWGNEDSIRFLQTMLPVNSQIEEYINAVIKDISGS